MRASRPSSLPTGRSRCEASQPVPRAHRPTAWKGPGRFHAAGALVGAILPRMGLPWLFPRGPSLGRPNWTEALILVKNDTAPQVRRAAAQFSTLRAGDFDERSAFQD